MRALSVVVFFLLFVDNFVKVGMRQPYPGIVAFFLWGILLSRLGALAEHQGRSADRVSESGDIV